MTSRQVNVVYAFGRVEVAQGTCGFIIYFFVRLHACDSHDP